MLHILKLFFRHNNKEMQEQLQSCRFLGDHFQLFPILFFERYDKVAQLLNICNKTLLQKIFFSNINFFTKVDKNILKKNSKEIFTNLIL